MGAEIVPLRGLNRMAKSSSFEVRLAEASAGVRGHYGAWQDELEARDRIVLEAYDDGWATGTIARWAGISPQRVVQIVARRGAEVA